MVDKIKRFSSDTKRKIENAYEVLAMFASLGGGFKLLTLDSVTFWFGNFPVWQVVGAVLIAGEAFRVFTLLNKE